MSGFTRMRHLWERYPQYHTMSPFTNLDALLAEHPSYEKDFEGLREEYEAHHYENFLIRLSWSDLPYRHATMERIEAAGPLQPNPYVEAFMAQFDGLDPERDACFLFPESCLSQFFVLLEVCKRARIFHTVRPLFPDEETVHYLAVFDREDVENVLLMYHLDTCGGYSLYDYPLPWYQTHLWQDGVPFRSPYLPDRLAKYMGSPVFCCNPARTVYVRRNIDRILECGYAASELDWFRQLTCVIMPLFQGWFESLQALDQANSALVDWQLERTRIRTRLTAEGVIKPKWKHELTLFHAVRGLFPDTLYQYRADWLGRQSLDLFVPSLRTAIEYQGIQHYEPIGFFGGEEALAQRRELDRQKKERCEENHVRLIEWPYTQEPTQKNIRKAVLPDSV